MRRSALPRLFGDEADPLRRVVEIIAGTAVEVDYLLMATDDEHPTYMGADRFLKAHPDQAPAVFSAYRRARLEAERRRAATPPREPDTQLGFSDAVQVVLALMNVVRDGAAATDAIVRANRDRARTLLNAGLWPAEVWDAADDLWARDHLPAE